MKKWKSSLLLIVFCLCFLFSGCAGKLNIGGSNKTDQSVMENSLAPEETLKAAFDTLKNKDYQSFNNYLLQNGYSFFTIQDIDFSSDPSKEDLALLDALFVNFSYKIGASNINGEKAVIKVSITNTDFSGVIKNLIAKAIKGSTDKDESSDRDLLNTLLTEANQTGKTVTTDLDITMKKTDSGWKMDMNLKSGSAIMGKLISIK